MASAVSLQAIGLDELIADMRRARMRVKPAMEAALDRVSSTARTMLQRVNPARTGYMRGHWIVVPAPGQRTVTNTASYAIYLFVGTYKMQPSAPLVQVVEQLPALAEQAGLSFTQNLGL